VSLDRYAEWCHRNGIPTTQHDRWLHLTNQQLAVVVTLTPPVSRAATIAALARVTDDTAPVLIETFNVPHGELYGPRINGNPYLGLRTWVRHTNQLTLAEPVRPT
jgi:hypothetical protein